MKNKIENIIKFIKKHDNIFMFILIAIIMLSRVYNIVLNKEDESYNFLNTYKIANGLIIYNDNNVIITPLFFYIGSIFLKLFGENYLVFRTYNLIISTLTFFICYLIIKKLGIKKKYSFFYTLLLITFVAGILNGGANYNVLSYAFYLLGLYFLLKMKKGTFKSIVQGIMLFITFLTYQKLGVAYFIAIIIYEIVNKDIKSLFKELLTAFILLLGFLLYLYFQNNLYNFVNYTILGMGEFGSTNFAMDGNILGLSLFLLLPVMALCLNIATIVSIKNYSKIENEKEIINNIITLFTFAICAYIIIIPILNKYHVYLAGLLMIINLIYVIHFLLTPFLNEKKVKSTINKLTIFLLLFLLIFSVREVRNYLYYLDDVPKDSPFYGSIPTQELKDMIIEVGEYIQKNDQDTIVISSYAPLISLYLNDLDNDDYDLALRGNLGKDGEQGLIEKIKQLDNTQILLLHETDEEKEIYQFAYDVANYIKQNYTYVGQVNKFDIYEIEN